jgi:hypothetical protein
VLSAETAVLAQRRLAVDLQGRALDARIGLIRAIAGTVPVASALAPGTTPFVAVSTAAAAAPASPKAQP